MSRALCHTPRICNFIDLLISWVRSFTESYLSDSTTLYRLKIPLLLTKIRRSKQKNAELVDRLIGVVFSNGAMLPVWDKSDLVNENTQEISELMKLHIRGVWHNALKFIRQLAYCNVSSKSMLNPVPSYTQHLSCGDY